MWIRPVWQAYPRCSGRAFDQTCVRPLNVTFQHATGRHVGLAYFADRPQSGLAASGPLPWDQPASGGEVASAVDSVGIWHKRRDGPGGEAQSASARGVLIDLPGFDAGKRIKAEIVKRADVGKRVVLP